MQDGGVTYEQAIERLRDYWQSAESLDVPESMLLELVFNGQARMRIRTGEIDAVLYRRTELRNFSTKELRGQ